MGLFSASQVSQINAIAAKSKEVAEPIKSNPKSVNDDLKRMSEEVLKYFPDSPAKLVTDLQELHTYIDKCIEFGYCGIDTETTGLDRIHDYVVGFSLYVPTDVEIYIPIKHRMPIFETLYPGQPTYEDCSPELQRLADNKVKLIFANADFDLAMIYKDFKVDLIPVTYYDVISAWRCLKENERDNSLKGLYAKYVMKGKVDPKKFSDFFTPALFPYCKPQIAALYAANDAKITYVLFTWQLPYVTKGSEKCTKHHLERIADLLWNVEFPMIAVCAHLHRRGVYLDNSVAPMMHDRYTDKYVEKLEELHKVISELIATKDSEVNRSRPFRTGYDFNPNSNPHIKYLIEKLLGREYAGGDKSQLSAIGEKSTDLILEVRGLVKLLGTYVDKLPNSTASDSRIHCTFKSQGAETGRMSSLDPNTQNIPSHAKDIRRLFRATPELTEVIELKDRSFAELFYLDRIEIDGEFVKVEDLHVGNVSSVGEITSISEKDEAGKVGLEFNVQSSNSKLAIKKPPYIMMSSDFSQQEPKLTAFCSSEPKMIDTFKHKRDIYATISSIAFNVPYEECLEFRLDENGNKTDVVNPEGKARRGIGKVLVLGLNYGMSISSIGDLIFDKDTNLSDEEKTKKAQQIFDAVMTGFPMLNRSIQSAQSFARQKGYTETVLGRRRHHPDMQLPKFEFVPMKGYVNPDVDPLDPETMKNKDQIPKRIVDQLTKEFESYKYFGKIVTRTKQLAEDKIKVINNTRKIDEASRKVWNAIVQGSAADLTKLAMLKLESDPEWKAIGGRLLIPVHDELICEVPFENREKGAEVLARCMTSAGDFLPFSLTCDVDTTFRWYGVPVEDVLSFDKPSSLNLESLSESEIKWIQSRIIESGYLLPVYKNDDGSKAEGIAAMGVNGKVSNELKDTITDYKNRYSIVDDAMFIEHIDRKVVTGVY